MATSQGYRIQALNIATAWRKNGYISELDILKVAEDIYKFIATAELQKENEKEIAALQVKLDEMTTCREHWKNSFWDFKMRLESANKQLEVAMEALYDANGFLSAHGITTVDEALAEIEQLKIP